MSILKLLFKKKPNLMCSVITISLLLFTSTLFLIFVCDYLIRNRACTRIFPYLLNTNELVNRSQLLLTPYLQRDEIEKARWLSYVGNWKGVESFSGFFTVNQTTQSNLFFWFFPSEHLLHSSQAAETVPLILYLQGGPSLSSLLGLFVENGPFRIDDKLELSKNVHAWTTKHSVLYIDSPVGSGFSTCSTRDAFATNQQDVARDLYQALLQFFKLFPELRKAELYVVGTSYAAKYVPVITHKIHLENLHSPLNFMNLKGLAIGSGYFDFNALIGGEISNYYYNIGFLDVQQRNMYEREELRHAIYFHENELGKAREVLHLRRFLELYAGFSNFLGGNALHLETFSLSFQKFLNNDCIQTAIHVGDQIFSLTNLNVFKKFSHEDYITSPQFELEQLLNASYRVLIYNAQFDVIIPHITVSNFIYNLTWDESTEFSKSARKLWKVDKEIAGYVTETKSQRLTMVLIRNAGHTSCADQPVWCLDMISRLTHGLPFASPDNIVLKDSNSSKQSKHSSVEEEIFD